MSDFLYYQCKIAEERAASMQYNHAAAALELAGIHKRLAELKSQANPLDSLAKDETKCQRDKMYAAAFYAVIGRMPTP